MAGNARIVLIEAAAGCGKSELLEYIVTAAGAAGAIVMTAVGSSSESGLPLGVLHQLVNSGRLDELRMPDPADEPPRVEAMQEFCSALLKLSATTPVVCCVDDLQSVDDASLQYLQYLTRHARSARILLVCTRALHHGIEDPALGTELLRQPNFERIWLHPLSPAAVAEALDDYPALDGCEGLADELHAISGGNPLLLRALLDERREVAAPVPGGPFTQAVVTCLRRSGTVTLNLAAALAALGELATPERAGRLLGISTSAAAQGISARGEAGIVQGHRFRHPAAEAAVLDRIAPVLVDPAWTDSPWSAEVLREAAEQLIAEDEVRRAATVLELAHQASPEEQQQAEIKTRLAAISWRINPAAAERHLSAPIELLRSGGLSAERMGPLARLLTAQGRIAEAAEVHERIAQTTAESGHQADGHAYATFRFVPEGPNHAVVANAERFLQATVLSDATLEPTVQAIWALVHCEQPERAVPRCRELLEVATRRDAPAWRAAFGTLLAEILLRLGDLRGAEQHALDAIESLSERNGSAFAYAPVAALIRARTAMGQSAAVARQLEQLVPERLFKTVYGLSYLRARGLYYLTANQFHAALGDFIEVGRMMKRWGLDRPVVLPWRTDAAEALLRLGDAQQAERLVMQQLSMPDAHRPWVRGISLRLRAATHEPKQRAGMLNQAVDELRRSGDRVELARAMADLGRALQAQGQPARGNTMTQRAWYLARECGAQALREEILLDQAPPSGPARGRIPAARGSSEVDAKLSDSERRVATLAAHGFTNREISLKLYITVSTVEQHLTRVYRKLNISRRQDLPIDLQLHSMELS